MGTGRNIEVQIANPLGQQGIKVWLYSTSSKNAKQWQETAVIVKYENEFKHLRLEGM